MLRKLAGKALNRRGKKENPAPKMRKINEENKYVDSTMAEIPLITEKIGEKRKSNANGSEPTNHHKVIDSRSDRVCQ